MSRGEAGGHALDIDELTRVYGDSRALDGLTLHIRPGELVALLGPSGCGKTTALRIVAGLDEATSGTVSVAGVDLHRTPANRRDMGMVFQAYSLFPHLSVLDNVAFGLKMRGRGKRERRDRAAQMLELVGLAAYADRYATELSGGQQQRVALARALAPKPLLLLMDEPFSNLDQELREHMGQEVSDMLKENDITCVMVTHDQNDAFALGDHVGVMADGAIVQWDTPYNLYHQPRTHFVADFIGNGIFLPGTVSGSARVATALGELESDEALDRPVESPIEVLLRPDDVVHDPEGPIRATVRRRAFKGAEIMYTLRTTQGITLLALFPSHANYEIGDEVSVRLAVDHLVVFDRDPED